MNNHSRPQKVLKNRFLYALHDILHVLIRNIRTCWQTEANLKQFLLYPIGIYWSTLIYWLLVHRLPYRTALNLLAKHKHAQSLYVLIRLTIGCSRINGMDYTSGTTHSILITSLYAFS